MKRFEQLLIEWTPEQTATIAKLEPYKNPSKVGYGSSALGGAAVGSLAGFGISKLKNMKKMAELKKKREECKSADCATKADEEINALKKKSWKSAAIGAGGGALAGLGAAKLYLNNYNKKKDNYHSNVSLANQQDKIKAQQADQERARLADEAWKKEAEELTKKQQEEVAKKLAASDPKAVEKATETEKKRLALVDKIAEKTKQDREAAQQKKIDDYNAEQKRKEDAVKAEQQRKTNELKQIFVDSKSISGKEYIENKLKQAGVDKAYSAELIRRYKQSGGADIDLSYVPANEHKEYLDAIANKVINKYEETKKEQNLAKSEIDTDRQKRNAELARINKEKQDAAAKEEQRKKDEIKRKTMENLKKMAGV